MPSVKNLIGQRFGRLVVLSDSGQRNDLKAGVHWLCQCDCGRLCIRASKRLREPRIPSCGCIKHLHQPIIDKDGTEKKWCSGCQDFVSINSFYKSKDRAYGFESYCKDCSHKRRTYYNTENLSDAYVARLITRYRSGLRRKDIPTWLIDLKRQQVVMMRNLKQLKTMEVME